MSGRGGGEQTTDDRVLFAVSQLMHSFHFSVVINIRDDVLITDYKHLSSKTQSFLKRYLICQKGARNHVCQRQIQR